MTTFVDTSSLYALLDEDDDNHAAAATWLRGSGSDVTEGLTTHSYLVAEACALVHRRLGTDAVRVLIDEILPTLSTVIVDEELHHAGLGRYRASLARRTSLVDHVSLEVMRWRGIRQAFAFGGVFTEQGFETVSR